MRLHISGVINGKIENAVSLKLTSTGFHTWQSRAHEPKRTLRAERD